MDREKSKRLSFVLRHKPESVGVELDRHGWTDAVDLMTALGLTREELNEEVETNSKKRFEFSDDGARIRACQGHSIDVDLGHTPRRPPETLYHGTAARYVVSIKTHGIQKMGRQQVHLSADRETAHAVGSRHGTPTVLVVDAGTMHRDGLEFFRSANGVWLTDCVPPQYL